MSQPKNCLSDIDDILERRESHWIQRGKKQGWLEMQRHVIDIITQAIINEQRGFSTGNQYTADVLKGVRDKVGRL